MAVGAADLRDRALVAVELEPAQRVEDLLDVLGRRALAVGVLDAQDERPAGVPREEPVVERGARAADVQRAGRRGSEADPHAATRTLCADADRRPRLPRRRPGEGRRARRRAAARARSRSSTRTRGTWKPTRLHRRAGRRLPRGDARQPRRRAADPRRLPAQLRLRGHGDPRQVADVADRRRCAPATRSARTPSCCTPARRRPATSAPAIERAGEVIARGARRERELPAAPREHRRRGRHARALVRGARRAARGRRRRRAPRALPGLLPPATPRGFDIRTRRGR